MAPVSFLDLGATYRELRAELDAAVGRVLASGWYILGPEVEAFEQAFAAHCGARHCVGLANGLDALEIGLLAAGVGPGDEVIVPSNTYIATWLAVTHVGATPVPVEPDEATHNLDPARIEAALTPRLLVAAPRVAGFRGVRGCIILFFRAGTVHEGIGLVVRAQPPEERALSVARQARRRRAGAGFRARRYRHRQFGDVVRRRCSTRIREVGRRLGRRRRDGRERGLVGIRTVVDIDVEREVVVGSLTH